MKRSQRWNTLQICQYRDSNSGGSDLWSNTLPTRPWRRPTRTLCVCVCVRERERERAFMLAYRLSDSYQSSTHTCICNLKQTSWFYVTSYRLVQFTYLRLGNFNLLTVLRCLTFTSQLETSSCSHFTLVFVGVFLLQWFAYSYIIMTKRPLPKYKTNYIY